MKAACHLCPHHCELAEGQFGFCRARKNERGKIIDANYGQITSIALDPIEKKPLARFHPGSEILSVGSFGCNLHCPFCQNSEISTAGEGDIPTEYLAPEKLLEAAKQLVPRGNIGVAYTYNEPLVSYEYVRDCAKLVHEAGLLNVLVTNGMICAEPLAELLPSIDALNIDLKGFTQPFYTWLGGDLETVKQSIVASSKVCHVEITTLVIPGRNDSEEEIESIAKWLASVSPDLTLHLSRFFPRYRLSDTSPTPVKTIYHLADVARKHLKYVFTGNC